MVVEKDTHLFFFYCTLLCHTLKHFQFDTIVNFVTDEFSMQSSVQYDCVLVHVWQVKKPALTEERECSRERPPARMMCAHIAVAAAAAFVLYSSCCTIHKQQLLYSSKAVCFQCTVKESHRVHRRFVLVNRPRVREREREREPELG